MASRRITINVDQRFDKALQDIMEATGKNTTDSIHISVKAFASLIPEIQKGATVMLIRPDGTSIEVILVY